MGVDFGSGVLESVVFVAAGLGSSDLGSAGLVDALELVLLGSLAFLAGASLPAMAAMLGKFQPNH